MTKLSISFALTLGIATSAQALPDFPEELQKAASTPCLPHCNVCHRDDNAGDGTIDRPFALSMERVGGLDGDKRTIDRAVLRLKQAGTDSDGDGTSDIAEL